MDNQFLDSDEDNQIIVLLKPLISQRIDGEIMTSNGVILTPGSQITAASGMILTMQSNGSFVDSAGNSFIMTHEGKLLDSAGNQSTVTSQVIEMFT